MKAVMLAAGSGNRLERDETFPPKVLLRFGGATLLERHIRILRFLGISELVLGVGYNAHMILEEIERVGAGDFVRTVTNPDFRQGAITTLWALSDECYSEKPVLMMDGDVLYDQRLLAKLVSGTRMDALLFDRDIEPGDEPVKICLRDGAIVDFGKQPTEAYDEFGEWVGFTLFSSQQARRVPEYVQPYIDRGETDRIYEVAIRDLLIASPPETFTIEEITGLPWIEIDFQQDVDDATNNVLPHLAALP